MHHETALNEEKSGKIFDKNQTGLHHETHRRGDGEARMISGLIQGTAFTVIPLNRESNFTCREKSHSQSFYDLLTWPELQVRPWVWCSKAALAIIGMSKSTEIYQMRGRVSHGSPCWMRNLQTGTHGPGGGRQRSKQHPCQITCDQKYGKTRQTQPNAKKNKSGRSKNQSSIMLEN